MRTWRTAMAGRCTAPPGFFTRGAPVPPPISGPARTPPRLAGALCRLSTGSTPPSAARSRLDVVDIGAGRASCSTALLAARPAGVAAGCAHRGRARAPGPTGCPPAVAWQDQPPGGITGLLVATEWLDNVPWTSPRSTTRGGSHQVLVDPATGAESARRPGRAPRTCWLRRWWPTATRRTRAEIGRPRDLAWAGRGRHVRRRAARSPSTTGTCAGSGRVRDADRLPRRPAGAAGAGRLLRRHRARRGGRRRGGRGGRRNRRRRHHAARGAAGAGRRGDRPPLALAAHRPGRLRARARRRRAAAELTDPAGWAGTGGCCTRSASTYRRAWQMTP